MGGQVFGVAIIKVDGQALRSEEGASCDIGGYSRTSVTSDRGDVGFAQKVAGSQVDCTIQQDADTKLDDIRNYSDVTVQFDCDTGQSYVINHAFLTNTPKTTAGGGKVQLTFMGPPAQEI